MNLILLAPEQVVSDDRYALNERQLKHIQQVLKKGQGDTLRVGVLNGAIGDAEFDAVQGEAVIQSLSIEPPKALPLELVLALPRPNMLKRTLMNITAMGVKTIHLLNSAKVEKSYWQSPVLTEASLHSYLIEGLEQVNVTLSPSMDIMVSSNFERLLFDAHGRDSAALADLMARFNAGDVTLNDEAWSFVKENFDSYKVDDTRTCEVISEVFQSTQYLLDPHTAIGLEAARQCWKDKSVPMITLATAHPVKFPEAVEKAGCDLPSLPEHMKDLFERDEAYEVIDNDLSAVQGFVADRI